jgi:NitT/TauT family transport system substrate-binding protein
MKRSNNFSNSVRAVLAAAAASLTIVVCGSSSSPLMAQTTGASTAGGGAVKPISFNYGLVTADQYAVYVAQDLGLFEKHGLKPNFTPFQSGALLLAALKSEAIDVASIGMGAVFAIGQNTKLKVIAWDVNSSFAAGFVSKQHDVKSFRDVAKAGKIGVAIGSCAQVALYYLAQSAGVPYNKLDVANVPPAQARNALHGDAIQSAMIWAPYIFQAVDGGSALVNYTTDWQPAGGFCPSFTAVREEYLTANSEVGKRLIAVQADALKTIEKDPSIAIKALQKRLSISESVAKRMFERVWDNRPTYAQQIDPQSPYSLAGPTGLAAILKRGAEAFSALKVVPKPIDPKLIDAAVDPTYIKMYEEASR